MRDLWVTFAAMALLGCGSCGGGQRPSSQADCPEGMVFVPGPGGELAVSSFCMDVTEVTVAAYDECDSGACAEPIGPPWGRCARPNIENHHNHPRNCVTYDQASSYCAWRGFRLPTSEEWQYAAYGNDGRRYPWGDEPPDEQSARWGGFGGRRALIYTARVGAFVNDRSPFGVMDMAGNVSEWVGVVRTSDVPLAGTLGASWECNIADCLSRSSLIMIPQSEAMASIGFRCAR